MRYETITEVLDFGPFVTKMLLHLGREVNAKELKPENFLVHVNRETVGPEVPWPTFMGPKPAMHMEGFRSVSDAYVSDKDGNKADKGSYVTLELLCHPDMQLGSIIVFNGIFNTFVKIEYEATVKSDVIFGENDEVLHFNEDAGNRIILGDLFVEAKHEDPSIPLKYVYYDPTSENATYTKVNKETKYPLLIWLHGAGEGGTEPLLAVVGNKVTNLISRDIQQIFDGAYLLAPQCPTMWMDDGSGEYTDSGNSMYLEALDRLIGDFIKEHDDIDPARIYIGGDSNGGFMTMKQIIYNKERYAAAFPVCEALTNKAISDDDIKELAKLPIWFTHAATDTTVDPIAYPITTYKRLMDAGAKNVHFTYWDKLLDLSGKYKQADGSPVEYYGHWSWIHMLNNDCAMDFDRKPVFCGRKEVHILDWLAMQHK